ncbi:MAG: hypothetical protein ACKVU4_13140 [Phycisphaerales bacterium]
MTPKTHPTPAPAPARDPQPRGVLCPFCGEVSPDVRQCRGCRAFLDPLSRQATQNEMGPWAIRDQAQPFRPGCSYTTVRRLVERGKIGPMTVIRGPTTRQAWSFAGRTPSVANLLGVCHNCRKTVNPDDPACPSCGASFAPETDRQRLGLAPVHLLPGQASPEAIASAAAAERADRAPVLPKAPPASRPPADATPRPSDPDHVAASTQPADIAALRARMARLWVTTVVLLAVTVIALAAAAAALLGVPPWFPANGRAPSDAEPAPPSTAQANPMDAPTEPPGASAEPPDEAVPPPQTAGGSDPTPPDVPLVVSPSRTERLDALVRALDTEPVDAEALLAAVDGAHGQDTDRAAWVESARRRAALRTLRDLP